jgi:capsular exopolysaccharide synthesis family protein
MSYNKSDQDFNTFLNEVEGSSGLDQGSSSLVNRTDITKLLFTFKRNILWLFLFLLIAFGSSYVWLRYTKPIYESKAVIKLEYKNDIDNAGLNFGTNGRGSINDIASEIEIIRSDRIFMDIAEELNLHKVYYEYGNLLNEEKFIHPPFRVKVLSENSLKLNIAYDVKIIDNQYFIISSEEGNVKEQKFEFKKPFTIHDTKLVIYPQVDFIPHNFSVKYYFKYLSEGYLTNYFSKNLTVKVLNMNAKTIEVAFKDYNRYKAQKIVNAINQAYLVRTIEKKQKAQDQTLYFIDSQLDSAQQKLKLVEQKMENLGLQAGSMNISEEFGSKSKEIRDVKLQKKSIREQLVLMDLLFEQVKDNNVDEIKKFLPYAEEMNNSAIVGHINKLSELDKEFTLLKTSYKENTLAYKRLELKLRDEKIDVLNTVYYQKELLHDKLLKINDFLSELKNSIRGLPDLNTQKASLERKYSLYSDFVQMLNKRKLEVQIARAGKVPEFEVLSDASFPRVPITPNPEVWYGVAIGAALFVWILLFTIRFVFFNKILSVDELQNALKVPVIGGLPEYKKENLENSRLLVHQSSKSMLSEALRQIRTNLNFINLSDVSNKIISVTSTVSGEGKTFVALNLGGVIALSGKKVVLLDFDLRKPKVHFGFDVKNDKGVSNLLAGDDDLESHLHQSEIENFKFITAGPMPPNPSELIIGKHYNTLMQKLKERFDVIIIDTPPVGLVTDAQIVMLGTDVQLFVVRSNFSKKSVETTINRLHETGKFSNLAVILNSIDKVNIKGYGGYGGYGYGYYVED